MAIQGIGGYGLPFPAWPTQASGGPNYGTTYTLDAASEKAAIIGMATTTKAIHKVHFRTGTVTTGATVDCRVETVDNAANGDPTGTLWATTTNGSSVVAASDDNVWKTATLTSDATMAIGDVYALVITVPSGSMIISNWGETSNLLPYGDLYTGTWTKFNTPPMILPEYADGSFEPIFGVTDQGGPINTNSTFNSGSTTNRRGNRFTLPFPARAKGCWGWVDVDGDLTIKLYDTDGTSVLATTATLNSFQRQQNNPGLQFYPFTTTASLAAGSMYRIAYVPGSVTNVTMYNFDVVSAAMLDMFPGGQNCHRDIYTSGAWANTTTSRTLIGVFLDGFDDGAQTGGGGGFIIGG